MRASRPASETITMLLLAALLLWGLLSLIRPAARPRCVCTEDGMQPGPWCRATPEEVGRCDRARDLYTELGVVLAVREGR
jgi:hypothetical protein